MIAGLKGPRHSLKGPRHSLKGPRHKRWMWGGPFRAAEGER
jgi:hypothetical protein